MKGPCVLMHKNNKVASCTFDTRGYLKALGKIHDERRMPINPNSENVSLDLQRWLLDRSVATNRRDLADYRAFYGNDAFLSTTGISFLDSYWFASGDYKDWEKENPYDNWKMENDNLFLMKFFPDEIRRVNGHIMSNSPNFTIPGSKQRIWYKTSNELLLLHGNPQTEISNYKKTKHISTVAHRNYFILGDEICVSIVPQVNKKIERIPFNLLYNACEDKSKNKMQNLQYCCEINQIPNWKDFFTNMFEYDEIIGNHNRELADIGVLRDSQTFEIIGFENL